MWLMNMGKPDSIPRLNEQMAIELGANLLGETIVFLSAAGIILLEYSRQVQKEASKEADREEQTEEIFNKIRDLSFRMESQDTQIRQLMHMMAELDDNTIKKPWKASTQLSKIDKHEFNVTKENNSLLISKSSETDK